MRITRRIIAGISVLLIITFGNMWVGTILINTSDGIGKVLLIIVFLIADIIGIFYTLRFIVTGKNTTPKK